MEDLRTLASCLNIAIRDGYTENFKVTERGMESLETERVYKPDQVTIVNFYRFEGASDPADSAIVYVMETSDGAKGTLTDAYGMYADSNVDTFIKEVEGISKKNTTEETTNH
jgi:hypothetical protein